MDITSQVSVVFLSTIETLSSANNNKSSPLLLVTTSSENPGEECIVFQFVLNSIILGFLSVLGLVGNTASIFILQRDRHNRVAVFLLQALAVADNLVLCVSFIALSVIYGFLPLINGEVLKQARPHIIRYMNPVGCAAQSCSIWVTVLLALNRYVAVCRPFSSRKWLTMTITRLEVLTVVTFSVVLNIPRMFEEEIRNASSANSVKTVENDSNTTFGNETTIEVASNSSVYWYFEVVYLHAFYTSVVLVLPLFLLVGFNILLMRQLQKSKRKMIANSLSYTGQQENNITVVMVVIIIQLVICHTPDRIIQIMRFCATETERLCPYPLFYADNFANLLVIFSSSTNFIIYYVFRQRFRAVLCDRLRCRRRTRDFDLRPSRSDVIAAASPLVKVNCYANEGGASGPVNHLVELQNGNGSARTEAA